MALPFACFGVPEQAQALGSPRVVGLVRDFELPCYLTDYFLAIHIML